MTEDSSIRYRDDSELNLTPRAHRGGGCMPPLLCLGSSDSPHIGRRSRAFSLHKTHQKTPTIRLASVKRQGSSVERYRGRDRSKGAALRRASSRLGASVRKAAGLRRCKSDRDISEKCIEAHIDDVDGVVFYNPEPIYSDPIYDVPPCSPRLIPEPLYDSPVTRLARITPLRRTTSEVYTSAFKPVAPRSHNDDVPGRIYHHPLKPLALLPDIQYPPPIPRARAHTMYTPGRTPSNHGRGKELPSTTVQVTYCDPVNNIDLCKTVLINATTTAQECISLTLDHLEMKGADPSQFQLWVTTGNDDDPYPLNGHEYPFSIKFNCVSLQDCNAEMVRRCNFILRQSRKLSFESTEGGKKVSKKARKSPIRIHKVFKRSISKGDNLDGSVNSRSGYLYGHSLVTLCEKENALPKPVVEMLTQLLLKGPFTEGIFRKSASARLVRELKEKLDNDVENTVDIENINIIIIAALFKDFLRSLPDCLLSSDLYEEWIELTKNNDVRDRIAKTFMLYSRLPQAKRVLLQHFLCVLYHITSRSSENMMSASNLAVCIGPSILWPSSPVLALSPEASRQVPAVLEFLIKNCVDLFGEDILHILGDPPDHDPLLQDSGAEELDSLHSLHSGHSLLSSGELRKDNSSIDSLEGILSPLPRKHQLSLTNLSRDSGLTMSDCQLYTTDEGESGSTSSCHSDAEKSVSNYSSGCQSEQSNERFQHYTAPNNPKAIYASVSKIPQKIYNSNNEHQRVNITYSTPMGYSDLSPNDKKYASIYSSQPNTISDVYNTQQEEAVYSIPPGCNAEMVSPLAVNSNFQRYDWMRKRSNSRKICRSSSGEGVMVRSNSEESLLNKYNDLDYSMSLRHIKEPASHLPDEYDNEYENERYEGRDSSSIKTNSAHYKANVTGGDWHGRSSDNTHELSRSASQNTVGRQKFRSTPHIHNEAEISYNSSTMSYDVSTPYVSRSNSCAKEFGVLNNLDTIYGTTHPPSVSGGSLISRNSSFKSERTSSMCTVVSTGSTSTLASNPPSYDETLNRRSLHHIVGSLQNLTAPSGPKSKFQEYAIQKENVKFSKAKQLYEESLRIYQDESTYPGYVVCASPAHFQDSDENEQLPPLPPKSEPPPLPPKQRANRRSSDGVSRLKQLSPVHMEGNENPRKSRSVTSMVNSFDPVLHKTIICTDDSPPSIPPKERTVIEIEPVYSQVPEFKGRKNTTAYISPFRVERKSIETQTDDFDLLDDNVRDEGIHTSGSCIGDHVTSVTVDPSPTTNTTEGRQGRARRRDSTASQRSRSVPIRDAVIINDEESDSDSDDNLDYPITHSTSVNDFQSQPSLHNLKHLDPGLSKEISRSVSQLRAIFGENLKGSNIQPPPYRYPPSHHVPNTSYHHGVEYALISHKLRPYFNYGEESYV